MEIGKKLKEHGKLISLQRHRDTRATRETSGGAASNSTSTSNRASNEPPVQHSTARRDQTEISSEARGDSASDGLFGDLVDRVKEAFGFGDDKETKRAEDKDENATIAVFDDFNNADKPGESTHGEQVEGVIQQEGGFSDEDIQRYQINSGGSRAELAERLAEGDEDALVDYIEQRYTGLLDNTSDGIEEILNDDDSKITTINQSQSVAEGRIVRDLWNDAKENPEFRSNLAEHLGLDPDVNDRELAQALVDDVGDVVSNSEAIAESKQRFDEVSRRAAEAGITHVVTSGNLGTFASEMDRLGVETDRQFYDSAFVNRHTLVVAASNETGRGGPTSASFNSPNANADVSAPGVNIDITTQDGASETNSGTSFAAPAVAALVAQIKAENPDLSPREIERLLERTADRVNGGTFSDVGHGTVNPEEALAAA
jgi:subtilisin family serine protease